MLSDNPKRRPSAKITPGARVEPTARIGAETTIQAGARIGERLQVEVDRSQWLRGSEDGVLLHGKTGHMCCMGFGCLAAGHSKEEIRNETAVCDVRGKSTAEKLDIRLKDFGTGKTASKNAPMAPDPRTVELSDNVHLVTELIYKVNDDQSLGDGQREEYLRQLGKQVGIEFTFSGKRLPTHVKYEVPTREQLFPEARPRRAATGNSDHDPRPGPGFGSVDGRRHPKREQWRPKYDELGVELWQIAQAKTRDTGRERRSGQCGWI